eukprot:Colp12_sorted_trinity150504_noHs@22268
MITRNFQAPQGSNYPPLPTSPIQKAYTTPALHTATPLLPHDYTPLCEQLGARFLEVALVPVLHRAVGVIERVALHLLPGVVELRGGEHAVEEVAQLAASAERVVLHLELVLEVAVPEHVNLLVGGHVLADELEVVHAQPADAHEHGEGVQQEEDEHPGEGRAVPVADGAVEEEQVGQRVPHQDRHEVLVVVPAHGVVDERAEVVELANALAQDLAVLGAQRLLHAAGVAHRGQLHRGGLLQGHLRAHQHQRRVVRVRVVPLNSVLLIRRSGADWRAVDGHHLVGHEAGALVQTQHEEDPPDELEDRVDHVQRGIVRHDAAARVADRDIRGDEVGHERQPPDPAGDLRITAADEQVCQDLSVFQPAEAQIRDQVERVAAGKSSQHPLRPQLLLLYGEHERRASILVTNGGARVELGNQKFDHFEVAAQGRQMHGSLSEVVRQIFELGREVHQHARHLVEALVGRPVQRGVAVHVALVEVRAVLHQVDDRLHAAVLRGDDHGAAAVAVLGVDVLAVV